MTAGDVVGQSALDRAHGATGIDGALRNFLRVNASVQDGHLFVQLAPARAENRRDFALDLFG